jgi:hypothetical protein
LSDCFKLNKLTLDYFKLKSNSELAKGRWKRPKLQDERGEASLTTRAAAQLQ